MIYHGNHVTITFTPQKLPTAQAALLKTGRAQCDQVSLYFYNAVISDVKDKFQESETIEIITELDSSVTAASIGNTSEFGSKGILKFEKLPSSLGSSIKFGL